MITCNDLHKKTPEQLIDEAIATIGTQAEFDAAVEKWVQDGVAGAAALGEVEKGDEVLARMSETYDVVEIPAALEGFVNEWGSSQVFRKQPSTGRLYWAHTQGGPIAGNRYFRALVAIDALNTLETLISGDLSGVMEESPSGAEG